MQETQNSTRVGPQLTKKEKQKKRIEGHLLKAGSFIPTELLQAIESDKAKSTPSSNPWSTTPCNSAYKSSTLLVRPFSVKGNRNNSKVKEETPALAKTTTEFPKNENDEDVIPSKEERQKMWDELESITAELDKKRQSLLQEFTMAEQGLSVIVPPAEDSKVEKVEPPQEDANEAESEAKSKEALASLETRLKELDAVKAEAFKRLNAYIDTIKTAKDETGALVVKEADKIEEVAAIMKDYHREASTSFSQLTVGLLTDKEEYEEDSKEDEKKRKIREEKRKIRELDSILARKTREYRKMQESREQLEQESLNISSISDRSSSSTSSFRTKSRTGSAKKTFVTIGKTRFKSKPAPPEEEKSVNIYKPNIPKKTTKRTLSSASKRSIQPEAIENNENSFTKLNEEEQERLGKLMLEYKDVVEAPKTESSKELEPRKSLSIVPVTPRSILNEEAISRIEEIDENLRQLVPIDKWEQWSLKTSIRSITTDSLLAESAPSRILDSQHTLDSLSVKNKYKNTKPGDKTLKKLAEEREAKNQLREVEHKLLEIQRKHRDLQGVITDQDKIKMQEEYQKLMENYDEIAASVQQKVEQALEESNNWISDLNNILSTPLPAIEGPKDKVKAIEDSVPEEKPDEHEKIVEEGKRIYAEMRAKVSELEARFAKENLDFGDKFNKLQERLQKVREIKDPHPETTIKEIEELLAKGRETELEKKQAEVEKKIDELLENDPEALEKYVKDNFEFSDSEEEEHVAVVPS